MGENLLEPVEQMFRDPFVFQSDNATCHRAMSVFEWFENNDRRKILCHPQSPDVNPMEDIWSWMKKDA